MRRTAQAAAGSLLVGLTLTASPAVAQEPAHWDLVQAERAFGDRAGDMPPGTCATREDSPTAAECRQRRILRMHVQDLNGDSWADVQVLHADQTVTTYLNRQGRFLKEPPGRGWLGGHGQDEDEAGRPNVVRADLNGDGRPETIRGQGGEPAGTDSGLLHQVTLAPIIHDGQTGAQLWLLDLERRRFIGFAQLVFAGDLTGDLAPDLLIAGPGMAHPHLYVNTAPAGRWAGVHDTGSAGDAADGMEANRRNGPVTWEGLTVSVGLDGAGEQEIRLTVDGREKTLLLRAGAVTDIAAAGSRPTASILIGTLLLSGLLAVVRWNRRQHTRH